MKRLIAIILILLVACDIAFAQTWVKGYTRKDGTYVGPYYRSDPNNTVQDNYNYYGNTNPYTGQRGTNYYRDNPTSDYYGTTPTYRKSNTYDSW